MSLAGITGAYWSQSQFSIATITLGTTAFTKTSYVQLTAGFTRAAVGLQISWTNTNVANADWYFFVDIAFGTGGSEVVVLRDYPIPQRNFVQNYGSAILPFNIPPNTRVSMRVSSDNITAQVLQVVPQFQFASALNPSGSAITTTLGLANPVVSLAGGSTVAASAATAATYGTPVQYSTGVPHRVRWIRAIPITTSTPSFSAVMLRVSADASGVNILGPQIFISSQSGNPADLHITYNELWPCDIAQGTPLYLSLATVTNVAATAMQFGLTLFG